MVRQQKGAGRRHVKDSLVEAVFHLQAGEVEVDIGALVKGGEFPVVIEGAAVRRGSARKSAQAGSPKTFMPVSARALTRSTRSQLGGLPQDRGLQVHLGAQGHVAKAGVNLH